MCGIAGKLHDDAAQRVDEALLRRMARAIAHRGPDDEGFLLRGRVGLAHRRLSIIDVAEGGQPLANEDGSIWVVYNGEIYNFPELRRELALRGHRFKTRSDTEVLVHLYEDLGPGFVERLVGMFAFALYDANQDLLLLARDRVGIKPLYYARTRDALVFASEQKALLQDPEVPRRVDPRAIDRLLRALYLPGPETLLADIRKLPPAHYLVARRGRAPELVRYWDLRFETPAAPPSLEDATAELDRLLSQVVAEHMLSDVPVGCLLSGGVDSTAVLDMASAAAAQPLSTFTVGFEGEDIPDEREFARLAARRYGTRHHEISISSKAFADFLPGYVWHMEEPVCEPPAIALHYVSKLAAEHVKVVLSGEGGDEAFAGYANYAQLSLAERLRRLAGPLARPLGASLGALARSASWRRLEALSVALSAPPARTYTSRTWLAAQPFARVFGALYGDALRDAVDPEWSLAPTREAFARGASGSTLNDMLYVDTLTWLPDNLLVKADKISMASSLELRVPLLDHRVLEFAARLPEAMKLSGGQGKRLLRRCFERRLPREILERPKAGFPVPYARWFRTELRDEIRDLLLDRRAQARGWFRRDALERVLRRNAEDGLYSEQVFCLAALEWWQRLFVDGETPPAPGGARA